MELVVITDSHNVPGLIGLSNAGAAHENRWLMMMCRLIESILTACF